MLILDVVGDEGAATLVLFSASAHIRGLSRLCENVRGILCHDIVVAAALVELIVLVVVIVVLL